MTKKERNAKWRASHPNYYKEYYAKHKEELKRKRQKRLEREKNRQRQAKFRQTHPNAYAEWLAKGDNLEKHREKCRAYYRAYYAKNRKRLLKEAKEKRAEMAKERGV